MRAQPLIAVSDVEASSRWYQRLLGCQNAHGGAEYERLVSGSTMILQLEVLRGLCVKKGPFAQSSLASRSTARPVRPIPSVAEVTRP